MAVNDALCIASVLTYLGTNLAAAVNSAIDAMQADGDCPDDLRDVVKTEVVTRDDLAYAALELPCIRIFMEGKSDPVEREIMTNALDLVFEVGCALLCIQRDDVYDATLDAHWYERALQLALESIWDDVPGVYFAKYLSSEVRKTGAEKSRNRRIVTVYYEFRLRTTRGN